MDGQPQIATGLLREQQGDSLTVEVVRDDKPSGVILSIPRSAVLDRAGVGSELRDRFPMGPPTADQLKVINSYMPSGAASLTAESTTVVSFVAADNLLSRSLDRWDPDCLATMAERLPGLPALLDHDWEDTSKEWGRIFAAEVVRIDKASAELLDQAGNLEQNRKIVSKEGLVRVVFSVFSANDSPVVKALRRGHSGKISTGGFRFRDYWCPICDTSFSDPDCPHIPPYPGWGIYPDEEDGIAPYATRIGLYDIGEASIVTIPNLPNAGIIR